MTLFDQQHSIQAQRKDQHVGLANQLYTSSSAPHFKEMQFVHHGLPEMAVSDVQLSTTVQGLPFQLPYFISAMTGGSKQTTALNERLAYVASKMGLAMASGSVSIAMNNEQAKQSFQIIRQTNPNGIVIANLGAHHSVANAQRAVDLLEANALQIHINATQELIMPEGDRDFSMWLRSIEQIVAHVTVPVFVKEVGFGMNRETVRQLANIGVKTVDVAGTGGTNFAKIENARRTTNSYDALLNWGQSTVISLLEAASVQLDYPSLEIIASGGVKNPLDIIKSLSLGAKLVGISGELLHLIRQPNSEDSAIETLRGWNEQLASIMTLLGAKTIADLQQTDLILPLEVAHWCDARKIDWRHYANRNQKSYPLKSSSTSK